MGRKSKCTSEVVQHIANGLSSGNYARTVIAYLGISESAYYNWLDRGEREIARLQAVEANGGGDPEPAESERPYVELVEAVKKASALGEMSAVTAVRSAFRQDWKAAMTFLERRFPDRWSRRDRTVNLNADLSQDDVDKLLEMLTPDELDEVERILSGANKRQSDSGVSVPEEPGEVH